MARLLAAFTAGVLFVLLGSAAALGKEGVRARLDTPAALEAGPGETTTIAWTLSSVERGKRRPFSASGVFVRLLSASGGEPVKAVGTEGPLGRYAAEVTVPEGGIGRIRIGLEGMTIYPGGRTEDADVYFPVENDPLAAPAGAAGPGASRMSLIWLMAGGALLALGALVAVSRVRVPRPRSPRER